MSGIEPELVGILIEQSVQSQQHTLPLDHIWKTPPAGLEPATLWLTAECSTN